MKEKKTIEKKIPENITPWSGGKVRYLPCPICKQMNPVSRANLRMRCSKCGTRLLSVKVVKNPNGKKQHENKRR